MARQLLFEGHLTEEIAPQVFKVLEPFEIDGKKWSREHSISGWTLYTIDNKAVCFCTGDKGAWYVIEHRKELGLWDAFIYETLSPYIDRF